MSTRERRPGVADQGGAVRRGLDTDGSSPAPAKLLLSLGGSWVDLARDAVYVEPHHLLPAGSVPASHRADVPGGSPVYGGRRVPVVRVFDIRRPGAVSAAGFVNLPAAFVDVAHVQYVVGARPGDVQQPVICGCGALHKIDAGIGRHGAELRVWSQCDAPVGLRAVIVPQPHPDPAAVLTADALAELERWLTTDGVIPGWPGETAEERIAAAQEAEQGAAECCDVHGDVPVICAEHGCPQCSMDEFSGGDCDACDRLVAEANHAEYRALAAERGACVDEDCPICEDCGRCRCELAAGGRSVCRWCNRCADHADPFDCDHEWWNPATGRWSS